MDAAIDRGVDLLSVQNRDGSGAPAFEQVAHFDKRNGERAWPSTRAQVPRAGDNPTAARAACSSKRAFRPELLWRRALGARTGDARRFEKHRKPSTCCRDAHRPGGRGGYPDHPGYLVDLSNTQYAALALRAAQHAGSKVPKGVWSTWSKACSPQQDGQTGDVAGFGSAGRAAVKRLDDHRRISVPRSREGLGKSLEAPARAPIDRQLQGLLSRSSSTSPAIPAATRPGTTTSMDWSASALLALDRSASTTGTARAPSSSSRNSRATALGAPAVRRSGRPSR